jgi:hypothetical protein
MNAETARVHTAPEYVLLYNAADRTWSVMLIDGARAAVHSTHATKPEAERELARTTKGGAR